MAWTQADLDAIDEQLKGLNVLQSLTLNDQTYTFRTVDEVLKLRSTAAAALTSANGQSRTRYAATSKGL